MGKKKALIIDDEVNFCVLLKRNLEILGGLDIYVANDGKSGIKTARKVKPDLIIQDVMMPGMDGFQVLEALKNDSETMAIPVVMLSAKSDEESKLKAAQYYDEEYITKPIGATELKAKIDEILARRGA